MKKIMKGILITILIAAGMLAGVLFFIKSRFPSNGNNAITDEYYLNFHSDKELEMKYSGIGRYDVSYCEIKSDNASIDKIRIWYPSALERDSRRYPMIMVVNASGAPASVYEPFFRRLASWGFITVGNEDPQTGTGETASITLETVLNLNGNIVCDRIDENNIGIIGYSQGGAGALAALSEYENGRVYKTVFTGSAAYHFMAENFGWHYDVTKIHIPYFMAAGTGRSDDAEVKDITKEFAGVCPLESLIENYNGITDDVLKVRARAAGAEHEEILAKSDGYMTAWMLYQLCGDEEAAEVFIGENAEILNNPNWQDVEKNR